MKHKKNILLFFTFFLGCNLLLAKVIFVNANVVNGNDDGISWEDAYSNFQSAINEAEYGDTIWVAQGIYKPTNGSLREFSLVLNNGVKWYGGFQGNETEVSQRDYELFPTILSGDIGIQGDSTDNSYHVVYTIGSDSTTIIDGFFIEKGQTLLGLTGSSFKYGGGMFIDGNFSNLIAKPVIRNCHFRKNVGLQGGGLAIGTPSNTFNLNPFITNCKFTDNYADSYGGAIAKFGGNANAEPNLFNYCIFKRNKAKAGGGGIHLDAVNEHHFEFCDFEDNIVLGNFSLSGSSINISSFFTSSFLPIAPIKISSCTFSNIQSVTSNVFIYIHGIDFYGQDLLRVEIVNSKFLENNADFPYSILFNGYYNCEFVISDCLFKGNLQEYNPLFNKGILRFDFEEQTNVFHSIYSEIDITNTVFADNASVINLKYDEVSNATVQVNTNIFNSTFFNNGNNVISKKANFISPNPDSYSLVNIANSIFWQDQSLEELFNDNNPDSILQDFNIHHSLLKSPDCIINGIDYCGDDMLYNLYPEFRDTMNNDFSLRSCSPAVNQGDNLSIDTLGIFFDIEGNPRILDDAVDLGAYETQAFEVLVPQTQNVKCNGGADGAITWVQHGTPPFIFEWDNGVTTGTEFTGLSAGAYSIAVLDADSCTDTFTMTVNQPLPIEIMDSVTAATGATNADGMIEVMPSGGSPNYQYLWSNGDTTALVENLLPGIYTVTVTDSNGCIEIVELEVGFMTAVNELDKKYSIQLIPNLMEQGATTQLVFDLAENAIFEIEIFNEIGQFLFSKKVETGVGKNTYELPVMSERGLFFVKIKDKSGLHKVLKFVIN